MNAGVITSLRWMAAVPFFVLAGIYALYLLSPANVPQVSIDDFNRVLQLEMLALPYCWVAMAPGIAARFGEAGARLIAFSGTITGMLLHAVIVAAAYSGLTLSWDRMVVYGVVVVAHLLALQPVENREPRGPGALCSASLLALIGCGVLVSLLPAPDLAPRYRVLAGLPILVPGQAVLIWGAVYFAVLGVLGLFGARLLTGDAESQDRIMPAAVAAQEPGSPTRSAMPPMQKGTALSRIIEALGISIRLPAPLLASLRQTDQARAAVYAIILADMDLALHAPGLKAVVTLEGAQSAVRAGKWLAQVKSLRREDRLPLLNIAVQTLATLPQAEGAQFLANVERLVRSDRRFTLFEFVLCTLLRSELAAPAPAPARGPTREELAAQMRIVLSVLARAGTANPADAGMSFAKGMKRFHGAEPGMVAGEECSADRLDAALRTLRASPAMIKESIVTALVECVVKDARIRPAEAELLAAMAVAIGTGIPDVLRPLLNAAKRG